MTLNDSYDNRVIQGSFENLSGIFMEYNAHLPIQSDFSSKSAIYLQINQKVPGQ